MTEEEINFLLKLPFKYRKIKISSSVTRRCGCPICLKVEQQGYGFLIEKVWIGEMQYGKLYGRFTNTPQKPKEPLLAGITHDAYKIEELDSLVNIIQKEEVLK